MIKANDSFELLGKSANKVSQSLHDIFSEYLIQSKIRVATKYVWVSKLPKMNLPHAACFVRDNLITKNKHLSTFEMEVIADFMLHSDCNKNRKRKKLFKIIHNLDRNRRVQKRNYILKKWD